MVFGGDDSETDQVLLTVSSTAPPATDLGFLLHKHPARVQSFPVSAGTAHVFYPEATAQRCTAALLLEIDPVALVRGRDRRDGFALAQYVNDRPYAAASMLAVALSRVFGTAMAGRCQARPELTRQPLPLEIHLPALPCAGAPDLVHAMFAPLGWSVTAATQPLDPTIPQWGESRYLDVRLSGRLRLATALNHLYVLLPVLDNAKHYWVSTDEVAKLIRAGEDWLPEHPEQELIVRRYLAHQPTLVASAVGRLAEIDEAAPETWEDAVADDEPASDMAQSLAATRRVAVRAALRAADAKRVVDLGCGEGALLRELLADPTFTEVVGVDVSTHALRVAARRLDLERLPQRQRERIRLMQSALTYRDERLAGFDAAVLMEVIEHVDPARLAAVVRTVFGAARPGTVVVTTPNREYNPRYPGLAAGEFRHRDHRFEWTRAQFRAWADTVATDHGYAVRYAPVGPEDPELGPATQLAVFTRAGGTGR